MTHRTVLFLGEDAIALEAVDIGVMLCALGHVSHELAHVGPGAAECRDVLHAQHAGRGRVHGDDGGAVVRDHDALVDELEECLHLAS